MPRGVRNETGGGGGSALLTLKIDVSQADMATLEELASRQFRTPGGQASFLIHQLLVQSKNGNVQLTAASKPLEWEKGN